jgi:hypothetical protein
MTSRIQQALKNKRDLSYFVKLAHDKKVLKELEQYTYTPGLAIFEDNSAAQRIWEPTETLKSLEYLARINHSKTGVSLPEINRLLSLHMPGESDAIWNVYIILKYLADNGRLKRKIDGGKARDGPGHEVTYSSPNYKGLFMGFKPEFS